ncbi:MAG: 4-(cytidine 5'-diphospho)-2-C-methyl-D-erythritol kinase [Tepidisphaeraceae bacterium]|jgi:4-diphosphocytidyl-2-C-methyl-D-erythritol kinase
MRILSPAKINLHLRIGPPAPDGFHPLLSWMCTLGLHDTIEMSAAGKPGIRLKCDRPDVPVDETNLIVRAGRALDERRGADVTLQKNVPMGGGLGGGSSNAAFALIGFNQIWNLNFSMSQLAEIGALLGSDVPFFLHGPSSVCAGRGERAMPIPKPAAKFAVLFFPKLSMSTAAVYRRFDEMKLGSSQALARQPDWAAWTKLPAGELLQGLVNDLEAPAFSLQPDLGEMRRHIERRIGRIVRMTGSGSTLFTLTDDRQGAAAAAAEVRGDSTNAEWFELAPDLATKSDLV